MFRFIKSPLFCTQEGVMASSTHVFILFSARLEEIIFLVPIMGLSMRVLFWSRIISLGRFKNRFICIRPSCPKVSRK